MQKDAKAPRFRQQIFLDSKQKTPAFISGTDNPQQNSGEALAAWRLSA
jgi:hypothetical protein